MSKIPAWVHVILALILLGFALLGATNAVHTDAKVVYGVLNAIAGAWLFTKSRGLMHSGGVTA
jgi:hypothetical protein